MHMRALVLSTCLAQGCAFWKADETVIPPGGAAAVPPAREIAAPPSGPIDHETIARYGGDPAEPPKWQAVTPVISLMPVVPQYGSPNMGPPRSRYAVYPPSPRLLPAQPAQEP